jgi:hypothetical protein
VGEQRRRGPVRPSIWWGRRTPCRRRLAGVRCAVPTALSAPSRGAACGTAATGHAVCSKFCMQQLGWARYNGPSFFFFFTFGLVGPYLYF